MQEKVQLLSQREREILRLMGTGMYLAEVATKLGLASTTVVTTATRASKKLDARHSYHAAILFLRYELGEEFKRSTWGNKTGLSA